MKQLIFAILACFLLGTTVANSEKLSVSSSEIILSKGKIIGQEKRSSAILHHVILNGIFYVCKTGLSPLAAVAPVNAFLNCYKP